MKILAGIVVCNPEIQRLNSNLSAIIPQVDEVIVVKNGFSQNEQSVQKLIEENKLNVIQNEKNLGIAAALNQLLEYGQKKEFDWLITLDQDSIAPFNMVEIYNDYMEYTRAGIICPYICDLNNERKEIIEQEIEIISNEEQVITSGSCINIRKAIQIGGFDERLFIDFVDTEFQKRMLLSGYKILRANNVGLIHEIGNIKTYSLFKFKIICTNHNPMRRYYQVRNRLYYKEKYYGKRYALKEKIRILLGTVKIVLFEKEKFKKIIATYNGFRDYRELL